MLMMMLMMLNDDNDGDDDDVGCDFKGKTQNVGDWKTNKLWIVN